jgi:hypothetical protein
MLLLYSSVLKLWIRTEYVRDQVLLDANRDKGKYTGNIFFVPQEYHTVLEP